MNTDYDTTDADDNVNQEASSAEDANGKIGCCICGARVHIMSLHLRDHHGDMAITDYEGDYPDAPLLSNKAKEERAKKLAVNSIENLTNTTVSGEISYPLGYTAQKSLFHEIFGFGAVKAAMSHSNKAVVIHSIKTPSEFKQFVPEPDNRYVFLLDLTKIVVMAMELNTPMYLHGHSGTGKSSIVEQVCALTGRPTLRVQHTRNMEESHILGQWVVRNGATVFELGPLAFCMKYGLVYLADEYDFAMPGVLALYQPVLEGKPLVIKEADAENRIIKPHPLFRFFGTGNTNGTGDETGLYQGTVIQNAANYERYGIVEEVLWMEKKLEIEIVTKQGGIPTPDAVKLVDFARMIRESFTDGKIGLPVSTRALINSARLGRKLGSIKKGLEKSYLNRLSRIDKDAAIEVINRVSIA